MNPDALAILAAALDGHNPRLKRGPGHTTLNLEGGPSDLEILIDALLYRDVPGLGKTGRVVPQFALRDVARAARWVMYATADHLGAELGDVEAAAVAELLRSKVRALRLQEVHDA